MGGSVHRRYSFEQFQRADVPPILLWARRHGARAGRYGSPERMSRELEGQAAEFFHRNGAETLAASSAEITNQR